MSEHESGPLDDDREALHAANTLLCKRREMRRMYAAPPIRSGLCSHCGAFGSLWHQTDSCESCFREHEAPQPVTFVDQESKMDAKTYAAYHGLTITEKPKERLSPYWTGMVHGFCLALGVFLSVTAFLLWRF